MIRRLIFALFLFASPAQGAGARVDGGTYENCMRLTRGDPDEALEAALAWRDGGDAARHCAAAALFGLGQFTQAAERFEALADAMDKAAPRQRAAMLAQAGAAWFQAADFERAHAAQSAALKLSPGDADILTDRAMTLAGAKNYWESIDDLNRVIGADPERIDALILRASAYRYVDVPSLAREDAAAALRLAPDRPEVLLEYGILRRLAGDRDGARRSWLKLIRLHDGARPPTPRGATLKNWT